MARKLLEIAASILKAQASVSRISPEEIERILMKIFFVLQRMQKAEKMMVMLETGEQSPQTGPREKPPGPVSAADSIRENKVICLECGIEMKQLTSKHLGHHGLTRRDYKKKWGIAGRTPLAAKSLSRARSRAAKKRGLPENLVKFQQERRKAAGTVSLPPPARG